MTKNTFDEEAQACFRGAADALEKLKKDHPLAGPLQEIALGLEALSNNFQVFKSTTEKGRK